MHGSSHTVRWSEVGDPTTWNPRARTVLCHGTFDLLHLGHIRHLEEAKRMGDRLVVSVTADQFVNKGMGRPQFNTAERVEALQALSCVDEVVVSESPTAVDVINRIKPALYVKGIDYAYDEPNDGLIDEREAVESHGGELKFTGSVKHSSSRLLNQEKFPAGTFAYLQRCREEGFAGRILKAIDAADKLRICFIGETIIDEYRYVTPLARPAKEFILAGVETSHEEFDGGVVAASRHAEWQDTTVVTPATSLRKTRFVEREPTRKVFEVYGGRDVGLSQEQRALLQVRMIEEVERADCVVVLDFGHGLMGPQERHFVESAKFLAVNAQTNAGNFGYNPITRYSHADYVCIDDPEARLATGMRDAMIEDVIQTGIAAKVNARRITVTNGRHGAMSFDRQSDEPRIASVPAFSTAGVDTMGAGDAFLAVAAPLLAAGLDLPAASFAGAVAGAIKVGIVGHRRHVERQELVQTIEALLK